MMLNESSMSFAIMNNVHIEVIDKKRNVIVKRVKTHNKATRKMVTGILNFVGGKLTSTSINSQQQYSKEFATQFIPCYFNVGDGGVIKNSEGIPTPADEERPNIPSLQADWTETVDYNSTSLVREFNVGNRSQIRFQSSTIYDAFGNETTNKSADMDSIYFSCQMQPAQFNSVYGNNALYVTELGLFAGSQPKTEDLLAYVKLGNYTDSNQIVQTNTLYVRPQDTIIIKWVISIAAIGKDNILSASIDDENGEPIVRDIVQIPTLSNIQVENIP